MIMNVRTLLAFGAAALLSGLTLAGPLPPSLQARHQYHVLDS